MNRLISVLMVFFLSGFLEAAVTYDNSTGSPNTQDCGSDGTACGGTTQTVSFTVGSGSNRQLIVNVMIGCNSAFTATTTSGVTYATVAMTKIAGASLAASAARYVETWAMPAGTQPASGTNDIVVTYSGTGACTSGLAVTRNVGAISFAGVDQTTTFTATNTNSGTGATTTVTITSSDANDLDFHAECVGTPTTPTVTGTNRWNGGTSVGSCNGTYGNTAAGGTTTMTATLTSDSWIAVAGSLKSASGSTAISCPSPFCGVLQ